MDENGGDSEILEEEIDESYEPTEDEVAEYANWLGIDAEKEKDLFWIAREGLKVVTKSSIYMNFKLQYRHHFQKIGSLAKQKILKKFIILTLLLVKVNGTIRVTRYDRPW